MAERIPPELQQQLTKLQQLQAQLNQIVNEKLVIEQELREINRALSILKDLPEDCEVYRVAGHLFIRISKADAEKELNERKEILEIRLKSLDQQESLIRKHLSEVQAKVNEYLSSMYRQRTAGS